MKWDSVQNGNYAPGRLNQGFNMPRSKRFTLLSRAVSHPPNGLTLLAFLKTVSSHGPMQRQHEADLTTESDSTSSKSPLSNFKEFPMFSGPQAEEKKLKGILRSGVICRLTGAYIFTADGSQPKKRGPKPDAKPALTRRQELNRQAQRCVSSM